MGAEEKRFFFNDAYLPLLGGKLHCAVGEKLKAVWHDVWPDVCAWLGNATGHGFSYDEQSRRPNRDPRSTATLGLDFEPIECGTRGAPPPARPLAVLAGRLL